VVTQDANVVVAFMRSIKNLVFAVSASARWHTLANCQESQSLLGNETYQKEISTPTINYGEGPLNNGNHFEKGQRPTE